MVALETSIVAQGLPAPYNLEAGLGCEAAIREEGALPATVAVLGGAIRVGLVATTFVLIFDQLLPANHQPAFLNGSQLRPLFSAAGQMGFRSLPPDVAATIDRLKKEQHI